MKSRTPETLANKIINYHNEYQIKYPKLTLFLLAMSPTVLIADIVPFFVKIQNQIGLEFYNNHRFLTAGGVLLVPLLFYAGLVVSIQHRSVEVAERHNVKEIVDSD